MADPRANAADDYPPGPPALPADLTRPTAAYRRHAWLALAGLLAFVALYVGLTAWFARNAYRNLVAVARGGGDDVLLAVAFGATSLLLALFLLKGLFAIRRGELPKSREVTPATEPRLFAFLHRLADETGAPRPHRVFLSLGVNAGVFYDLSLVNLLIPTRKNLDLGLGLVNALTLSELKAVLAHEFGHFAQRTMAVGRWVYIARQVVAHLVATRDWFDKLLQLLSGIDLRIAWIGWILRLITWSVRSLLDTAFSLTLMAERALSREMEFQADIVAVSVTGSDALIHALHKLTAAEGAFDEAVSVLIQLHGKGKQAPDLFALQSAAMERVRKILDDPTYGEPPPLPPTEREQHRVFQQEVAVASRMWSTHPENRAREDNAKRRYTEAPMDARSAWSLFADPDATRRDATERVASELPAKDGLEPASAEDVQAALDEFFGSLSLDPRYRGVYLGRSPVIGVARPAELYGPEPPPEELRAQLQGLYPEALKELLERWKGLEEEHATLEALRDGILSAPGGVIRHRGQGLERRRLPGALAAVASERNAARHALLEHDRACRTAHLAAARALGGGYAEYLEGLAATLHYTTHAVADLSDAQGHLANVFSVVIADGTVTAAERARLVVAATELYQALQAVDAVKGEVELPAAVTERLEVRSWAEAIEPLKLGYPSPENIGDWLKVVDGWIDSYRGPLSLARSRLLDELLRTESHVARSTLEGLEPGTAPPPPRAPRRYPTRPPGTARERQRRLGLWDRFMTADGFFPAALRLAVAAAIVGTVLGFGATVGTPELIVYNALEVPVVVTLGATEARVPAGAHVRLGVPEATTFEVVARTELGAEIERFQAATGAGVATYVYNVAAASPLVELTAVYGPAAEVPPRNLGLLRWQQFALDHYFEEPPQSVSTSRGGSARRVVLAGAAGFPPESMLAATPDAAQQEALALTQARWVPDWSPRATAWLMAASNSPAFPALLQQRLQESPRAVAFLRVEQDTTTGKQHDAVCARHRKLFAAAPRDPDLAYVATRCAREDPQQGDQFIAGHRAHPEHPWFAYAAGSALASRGDFSAALQALRTAAREGSGCLDVAALLSARVARTAPELSTEATWPVLRKQSAELDFLLRVERGEDLDGAPRAYTLLGQGRLEEALRVAEGSPQYPHLLRLVGASDGAPRSVVEAALALPADEGLRETSLWSALALAAREGREQGPLLAVARKAGPPALIDAMLAPLASWRRADGATEPLGAEPPASGSAPDALPEILPLDLQAQLCVLYRVLDHPRVPKPCSALVSGALFPSERPYFAGE